MKQQQIGWIAILLVVLLEVLPILSDTVKIHFGLSRFMEPSLLKLANDYMADNPNVEITFTEVVKDIKFQSDLVGFIKNQIYSGSDEYTIFMLDVIHSGDFKDDMVDLKPYFSEEELNNFLPILLNNDMVEGKLVGAPFFSDALIFWYRKDLYKKYGFHNVPKTLDEINNIHDVILQGEADEGNTKLKYGYTIDGAPSPASTCQILWIGDSVGGGELIENIDGNPTATCANDKMAGALKKLHKTMDGRLMSQHLNEYSVSNTLEMMLDGETISISNWPFVLPELSKKWGAENIGFTYNPGFGETHGKVTLGGWRLSINKNVDKTTQDEAAKFIKFLTSFDSLKYRALNESHMPPITSLYSDPDICANNLTKFLCELDFDKYLIARPSTISAPHWALADEYVYRSFELLLQDRVSEPLPRLEILQEDLNDFLGTELKLVRPSTFESYKEAILIPSILTPIAIIIFIVIVISIVIKLCQVKKEKLKNENEESTWYLLKPSVCSITSAIFFILVSLTAISIILICTFLAVNAVNQSNAKYQQQIIQSIDNTIRYSVLIGIARGKTNNQISSDVAAALGGDLPHIITTENMVISVFDEKNIIQASSSVKASPSTKVLESQEAQLIDAYHYIEQNYGAPNETTESISTSFKSDNIDVFLISKPILFELYNIRWRLILTYPSSDVLQPIYNMVLIVVGVSIVIVFIAVILGSIYSFLMSMPLRKLIQQFKLIEDMELNQIENKRFQWNLEFEKLQRGFAMMVDHLVTYKSYMPQNLFLHRKAKKVVVPTVKSTKRVAPSEYSDLESNISSTSDATSKIASSRVRLSSSRATIQNVARRTISVMCLEIRNFNVISQKWNIDTLQNIHSSYVEICMREIAKHCGEFDQFRGSRIIATWNAVQSHVIDHKKKAISCALGLQSTISSLNHRFKDLLLEPLVLDIGISSGMSTVGTFGTDQCRAFNVISNLTNEATLFKSLCIHYDQNLLFDDSQLNNVRHPKKVIDYIRIEPYSALALKTQFQMNDDYLDTPDSPSISTPKKHPFVSSKIFFLYTVHNKANVGDSEWMYTYAAEEKQEDLENQNNLFIDFITNPDDFEANSEDIDSTILKHRVINTMRDPRPFTLF